MESHHMKVSSRKEPIQLYATEPEQISLHLWLQYVQYGHELERYWHWSLHVVIDEMTTADELRKAWGKIDSARQRLTSTQGSDPKRFSVSLLSKLSSLHKTPTPRIKYSYGMLAQDLNFDALVYLLWAGDKSKSAKEQRFGFVNFVNLFHAFGFKNPDLSIREKDARKHIEAGHAPWGLQTGPITKSKVVHALEQFEQAQKSGAIVLGPSFDDTLIETIWERALILKYWPRAKDLLEKDHPNEFAKYLKRYNLRATKIILRNVQKPGSIPE
jgi:hypothetical protein